MIMNHNLSEFTMACFRKIKSILLILFRYLFMSMILRKFQRCENVKFFKTLTYWKTMPEPPNASRIIKEFLVNTMGYKIFISTKRDWHVESDDHRKHNIQKNTKKWL